MKMLRHVIWMALFLLLVEAALEFRAHRRHFDTIFFGAADTATASAGPAAVGYGPSPEFPFRSRLTDRQPAPGTVRIWLGSASFAEDVYVRADRIFPSLAAGTLVAAGLPIEILNASEAGHDMGSSTLFLQQQGAVWQPRAAVLYQMSLDINGISARLLGGETAGPPGVPDPAGGKAAPGPGLLVSTYESTTIYQTLKERVAGQVTQERILATSLGAEAAPLFRERLQTFITTARELGIEPVLCTFATSHDAKNYREMPLAARNSLFRYNIHLALEGWVETVAEFNAVIDSLAAAEDVFLIDIAAEIGGRPEYFRDFVHFNEAGHVAMAEALAAGIEAYLDTDGARP